MTVKVAGTWELGWLAPLTEYDLWQFPLADFAVDEWIMAPVSGINAPYLTEVDQVVDAIATNLDLEAVIIDERGTETLRSFTHPQDALYVLGKASWSPLGLAARSVRIETPANKAYLWPHQAIAIVLYDRESKLWQLQ